MPTNPEKLSPQDAQQETVEQLQATSERSEKTEADLERTVEQTASAISVEVSRVLESADPRIENAPAKIGIAQQEAGQILITGGFAERIALAEEKIIALAQSSQTEIENLAPTQKESKEVQELSPEILQKVMAKVQDINRDGIGFSGLGTMNHEQLNSLFKYGMLGGTMDTKKKEAGVIDRADPANIAKNWAVRARTEKDPIVHINITGRFQELKSVWEKRNTPDAIENYTYDGPVQSQIDTAMWTKRRDGVTVLVDLSSFKEIKEGEGKFKREKGRRHSSQPKPKAFLNDDPGGKAVPTDEYGFTVWHRVAPRNFSGIFLRTHEPQHVYTEEEVGQRMQQWGANPDRPDYRENVKRETKDLNYKEESNTRDETDPQKIQQHVNEVVKAMQETYKDKPEMMVPIYDRGGNLLWPQQMSYEETQKFVAERDRDTTLS